MTEDAVAVDADGLVVEADFVRGFGETEDVFGFLEKKENRLPCLRLLFGFAFLLDDDMILVLQR